MTRSTPNQVLPRATGFRRVGWGIGLFVLILAVLWIRRSDGGPKYEGRSAEAWFRELCRAQACAEGGAWWREQPNALRARTALVRLGTNAVPLLVREALTLRKDNAFRSNLHKLFLELPEWAGAGSFVPYGMRLGEAHSMLRALHSPADVVLPLVEGSLNSTSVPVRYHALQVLGTLGPGAELAVPWLVREAAQTNDWQARGIAWQSIRFLGPRGAGAMEAFPGPAGAHFPDRVLAPVWADWLAGLGAAAAPALPWLEACLTQTNGNVRLRAALTLIQLRPDASNAVRVLTEASRFETNATAEATANQAFVRALVRYRGGENSRLADLLEPWARREAARWESRKGGEWQACLGLERVAPDRARALYEEAMKDPGPDGLFGATGLLRLDPNHPEATRRLVEALPRGAAYSPLTIQSLGSASATNRVAIEALEGVVSGRIEVTPLSVFGNWDQVTRAQARESLERIRYRAARAEMGLPEREW